MRTQKTNSPQGYIKNWVIDIAKELDEYLNELNEISLTIDGASTLNFAEAALSIQGSVCIYSKKVEYFYTLIFQTLDELTNSKSQKKILMPKKKTIRKMKKPQKLITITTINRN